MRISHLTPSQLEHRLSGPGLSLKVGPFIFQIRTSISPIAQGLQLLYSDFPIACSQDFADFHIRFEHTRQWRHPFRPYVSAEVEGERPSVPVPLEQAYAVFEGCLNWCIYTGAYQYLIIHAAAIERGGRAAILPAPPGSGKSTLCAALVNRGWRLLTDELTLIDTDNRAVVPIARPVSLKNESIDVIKKFAPDAEFGPISPNTIKGTIAHMKPPRASVERINEYCPVAWLIQPNFRSDAAISARAITPGEAFMKVAESAVNYMALGKTGFDVVAALTDQMACYRLEYGDLNDATRWFHELGGGEKAGGESASLERV